MPTCPHCQATISNEAQALLDRCKCGAPMAGKVPSEPVVLVPPGYLAETQAAMPGYDVRATEPLPEGDGIEPEPEPSAGGTGLETLGPRAAGHARRRGR